MWALARLVLFVAFMALCSGAQTATDEDKLKAEFLVRFAGFTTWPMASFEGEASPVVIGVWQSAEFAKTLSSAIGARTAGERRIVARTIRVTSEIGSVHILFIPASASGSIDRILAVALRHPVLTVSEVSGFCRRGGALNFYTEGRYIRFEANPDAARSAGLQISSQLLRLARIVRG